MNKVVRGKCNDRAYIVEINYKILFACFLQTFERCMMNEDACVAHVKHICLTNDLYFILIVPVNKILKLCVCGDKPPLPFLPSPSERGRG